MNNVPPTIQRFYELDLLRFIAALSVVLFHYTFLNVVETTPEPTYPILKEIFKYGYLGVELFFIISGFVILLTATKTDWRGFIVSRISRLYPAFWISVTLTSLVIIFFGGEKFNLSISQYLWNLTMISEYVGVKNIEPVYWTLQVEIKFYFWVFFILIINKIQYIERFLIGWLVIAILEVFHFKHEFTHYFLMPEWAPYFSSGALFYLIYTKGLSFTRSFLLLVAFVLSIYFAILGANEKTLLHKEYFSSYVVVSLISFYFLFFSLLITGKFYWFRFRWLVTLGAISYPLYLIHMTMGKIIFQYDDKTMNKYSFLILVVMFMIFLSYVLSKYLEVRLAKQVKLKLERIL